MIRPFVKNVIHQAIAVKVAVPPVKNVAVAHVLRSVRHHSVKHAIQTVIVVKVCAQEMIFAVMEFVWNFVSAILRMRIVIKDSVKGLGGWIMIA